MSCRSGRRLQPGDERQDFSRGMRAQKADQRRHHHRVLRHGGYDWARTGRNANPRALVAKQLLPYRFAWPQTDAAPFMNTIELVDPELRDALAQPLPPLTAESLTQRRANALELAGAVPKPNLPDIATDEIHVESAFGAKPIRVLTYRPITSNDPLPVIVHIHGGGFAMGRPETKDAEK